MNKYNAKCTTVDGYTFDSKAEAARYSELALMQKAGAIAGLVVHPRFIIFEGETAEGKRQVIHYEADFQYYECERGTIGWKVVEDVKGVKTEAYKIKRKMFTCRYHNVKFVEIGG